MKNLLILSVAVITGILAALTLIFAFEAFSHLIYPVPKEVMEIDLMLPENKDKLIMLMNNIPTGSLLLILIGYMFASFAGGFISTLINKTNFPIAALIVGALLTLNAIMNLVLIPHPIWFAIICMPSFLVFTWFGSKLARQRILK